MASSKKRKWGWIRHTPRRGESSIACQDQEWISLKQRHVFALICALENIELVYTIYIKLLSVICYVY